MNCQGPTRVVGLPGSSDDKESACQCRWCGLDPWVGKIPRRREWQPTPVFLPGESHGQKNRKGYNPWGPKQLDTTNTFTLTFLYHLALLQLNMRTAVHVISRSQHLWEKHRRQDFLVVQGLRLCTPNARDLGSIPGQETRSYMPQLRPSAAK